MDIGFGQTAPAHADHVEPDQISERALRHSPRNDVGANPALPDDHGAVADTHELPHGDAAAEHDVVANRDVTAEHRVVGKHDIASDMAIMPDMRTHHQETMVANAGLSATVFGAG